MTGVLIGLGGKLRAGKDAVGDYLEKEHGFVKLGMSDALNEALLKLNPLIPLYFVDDWKGLGEPVEESDFTRRYQYIHDTIGYVEAKKIAEVRRLLQVLGTEVGREMIDPEVWVNIAEKKIQQLWAEGKKVVITAMRFPNEIDMLKRLNGLSVWVERPDVLRGAEAPSSAIASHASETSVNQSMFYVDIMNDRTLEDLYDDTETIVANYGQLVNPELRKAPSERV